MFEYKHKAFNDMREYKGKAFNDMCEYKDKAFNVCLEDNRVRPDSKLEQRIQRTLVSK